jgi:hypothetical protein
MKIEILSISISLISLSSHASWLCTEASSLAQNDFFYSCGVGNSNQLNIARKEALNNAKEEFNAFCTESYNCKNNEYIVSPLRTDCKKINNEFICYRGLEYRILDKKREYSNMTLSDLKKELTNKENELRSISERINTTNKILQLNSNTEQLEKSEKTILELDKLANSYQTKLSQGVFALKLSSMNVDFETHSNNIFSLGFEYEKFIISDIIGYNINMNYLTGTKSEAELEPRGTPNSTSENDYHSHKGLDISISLPIHIYYVTIAPKFGHTSISYKQTANVYNNFGVALDQESDTKNFSNSYSGLNIKYGDKFFGEIEPRKYSNQDDITTSVGIGIKINY